MPPAMSRCGNCGWEVGCREDISEYLSSPDRKSADFGVYINNYDKIADDDLSKSIQDPFYLSLQNEQFLKYLGNVDGKHLCDVGVGQGLLINSILRMSPASITAVDISVEYLKRFSHLPNVETVVANAERLPFRAQFDVITAADILEHVFNPADLLVSVNRALRSGGRFVVKTPYRENLVQYSRILGCPYNFVHLRSFDKNTLTDILKDSGFQIDRIHYDGFLPMRVRDYIKQSSWLNRWFEDWVRSLDNQFRVGEINPNLARLIMRPLEISVVATKAFDI